MTKLKNLIGSLKAGWVVIVENDFQYITIPERIVGKYLLISESSRIRLLNELNQNGFSDLTKRLQDFILAFNDLEHNSELQDQLLPNDLREYLNNLNAIHLFKVDLVTLLESYLGNDDDNTFKDIFLRYGIFSVNHAAYSILLDFFKQNPHIQIAYYKYKPTASQIENFTSTLIDGVAATKSSFYIAIVDKVLGQGNTDEQGKEFIKNELIQINRKNGLRFVGFLLTSSPADNVPDNYQGYFIREISKTDNILLETIAERIAQAAYAEVFYFLNENHKKSSDRAFNSVLVNQRNIKYIVRKSHQEGIPPYDASRYWFDLAVQKNFEESEVEDFKFIGGLTSFFSEDFIKDHPNIERLGNELRELNSFELFDYNINKKHLAIAPGDIFRIDKRYFILVGQLCDLLLRQGTNSRNAKFAELLEVEIVDYSAGDQEKYFIKVDNGGIKTINIEHFTNPENGDFKMLQIEVSTKSTHYADFNILDLCMFNDGGDCVINAVGALDDSIKNVLAKSKSDYFNSLQAHYVDLLGANSHNDENLSRFKGGIDFSSFEYLIEGSLVKHDVKRLARLKGRYYDSLYNNFINNQSRIDLNLIDNSYESISVVTLKCMFSKVDESMQEIEEVNLWQRKNEFYFKKDELIAKTASQFHKLLNKCSEKMPISENGMYQITRDEENSICTLELKFFIGNNHYVNKANFSYKSLFNEAKPLTKDTFRVIGSDVDESFMDAEGHLTRTLKYTELLGGVIIHEKGKKYTLVDGVLETSDINE